MKNRFAIIIGVALVFLSFTIYSACKERRTKMKSEKAGKIIKLPAPRLKGTISLEECIQKRRSKRAFTAQGLTIDEISQMLWATQGITEPRMGFRSAPSAGALYPLEVYVVKADGLYHYQPAGHKLERLGDKDFRASLARAALGQQYVAQAPIDIVICAVYERVTAKYGNRGIRYTHIEVGHAAQNLLLEAVALGLGAVPIGAFRDDAVMELLSLPEDHKPLYIIPIGHPADN